MMPATVAPEHLRERMICEEATGISENPRGLGTIYLDADTEVLPKDVYEHLMNNRLICVPNAGAGSFREFFTSIAGFSRVEVVNWCSSAGDWVFGVCDGDPDQPGSVWRFAYQASRYPRCGFEYSVETDAWFDSFEDLCAYAS